jgi:phage terminase small subunit
LSAEAKQWWGDVCEAYSLEPHHLKLLQAACEAWDAAQRARLTIAKEGQIYMDRYGCPKPHPCTVVERDSRIGFARLVRELGLDDDQASPSGRPAHPNSKRAVYFSGNN